MVVNLLIRHIHYDKFRQVNCVHQRVVLKLNKRADVEQRPVLYIKIQVYKFLLYQIIE